MNGCLAATRQGELALEYVPAASPGSRRPLFLIHGWGNTRDCWRPLLPQLARERDVYLVDLPGFGASADCGMPDLADVLAALGSLLPHDCVLLGWSLGGNLALRLAVQNPEKVAAVATLATNVSFVASECWPDAMAPAVFDSFYQQFAADPVAALKRFCGLEAQGDSGGRALLKALREQSQPPQPGQADQWRSGLGWLAQLEHRDDLKRLTLPMLHLFGEQDALVPVSVARAIEPLSPGRTVALGGAGHAMHLSQPQQVLQHLQQFLATIECGSPQAGRIDKSRMARSFSNAAATYDGVAHVQTRVGQALLARLPPVAPGSPLLDLGCGTGFCSEVLLERKLSITALDIAPGMLRKARQKMDSDIGWVCADAEHLPFAAESFRGVVSNLTVQWSEHLPQLFAGLADALKPAGWLLFSTLGPATLHELRTAWSAVDGYTHVNAFVPASELRAALTQTGFEVETFEQENVVPCYERVQELMRELKALGAHNANVEQNRGLTGPRYLRSVAQTYEQFRQVDGKLPASYQVFYVLARKR